jgi:hypothetical protein
LRKRGVTLRYREFLIYVCGYAHGKKTKISRREKKNASTRKRRPLGNAHFFFNEPPQRRICPSTTKTHWEKEKRPKTHNTYIFTLYSLTISCIRPFDYSLEIYIHSKINNQRVTYL